MLRAAQIDELQHESPVEDSWQSVMVQRNFIAEDRSRALGQYFLKEIERRHPQNDFNNYSFPPTEEFWDIVRHDGNKALLDKLFEDFHFHVVRLLCRPQFSVTPTHFDCGFPVVFAVCVLGEKVWSIEKVRYWDLLRLNFWSPAPHHTYDGVNEGRSVLFHGNQSSLHLQDAGTLLFLPAGWYHTVLYTTDVISFDIVASPKKRPEVSEVPVAYYYAPGFGGGDRRTRALHRVLHFGTHLLRMALFPANFFLYAADRLRGTWEQWTTRKPEEIDKPASTSLRPRDEEVRNTILKVLNA